MCHTEKMDQNEISLSFIHMFSICLRQCECGAGYMRDPRDRTRCKATEGHASLLFARRHDIRKISLDRREMTSIVNDTKSATALDFVFRTGMIFWSDVSEQKIFKYVHQYPTAPSASSSSPPEYSISGGEARRARWNNHWLRLRRTHYFVHNILISKFLCHFRAPIDEGTEKTVVSQNQMVTSDGLAVDWIYNNIYFTDTRRCTIELMNFDGNMGKILIKDDLEIPRAIALDPIDGYVKFLGHV